MSRALTSQQLQVLRLTADGKQSKDVAEMIGTTTRAVDAHMNRIMNELGTNTRAGTVAFALRRGIIK